MAANGKPAAGVFNVPAVCLEAEGAVVAAENIDATVAVGVSMESRTRWRSAMARLRCYHCNPAGIERLAVFRGDVMRTCTRNTLASAA